MTKMTSDFVELKNLTAEEISTEITKAVSKYGHGNVTVETKLQESSLHKVIRLYLECKRPMTKEEIWATRRNVIG